MGSPSLDMVFNIHGDGMEVTSISWGPAAKVDATKERVQCYSAQHPGFIKGES